jgi:uncharacterized protein (TIGR02145 family)
MKNILLLLLSQFFLTHLFSQKLTENIVYTTYVYKCSYCTKKKNETKADIANIKDQDVLNSVLINGFVGSMLGASSEPEQLCDISRTGKHNFVLISKSAIKKAVTVDKGELARNRQREEEAYSIGREVNFVNSGNLVEGRKRVSRIKNKEEIWGYVDEVGILKIPFKYTIATDFKEGLAAINECNGCGLGFIDINGRVIIPLKYEEVNLSYNGEIEVKASGKWETIVNPIYAEREKIRRTKVIEEEDARKKNENEKCMLELKRIKQDIDQRKTERIRELQNNSSREISKNYTNSSSHISSNYPEIKIGNQIWMQKNLDVKYFSNGDIIREAKSMAEWQIACLKKEPVFCYLNFDEKNEGTYGLYYNYYALTDERGIAPQGWVLPTFKDFQELERASGAENPYLNLTLIKNEYASPILEKVKKTIPLKYDKAEQKRAAQAINRTGFSAVLGGALGYYGFNFVDESTRWWVKDIKMWIGINISEDSYKQQSFSRYSPILNFNLDFLNCFQNREELENYIGYSSGHNIRCLKK